MLLWSMVFKYWTVCSFKSVQLFSVKYRHPGGLDFGLFYFYVLVLISGNLKH